MSLKSPDEFLILFLLNYDILPSFSADIKVLVEHIRNSSLPVDILILKLFEYIAFKGIDMDVVYDAFKGSTESPPTLPDDMQSIVSLVEMAGVSPSIFKPFANGVTPISPSIIRKFSKYFNLTNDNVEERRHVGLPLPDINLGRPRLQWCRCTYRGCGRTFSDEFQLINHLTKCNVYNHGYHYYHEVAVMDLNLSPEKALSGNLVICPSLACNHSVFETPQQLVSHLTELGIEPFWKPGMVPIATGVDNVTHLLRKPVKAFLEDECVVCMNGKICVMMDTCRHQVYCLGCFVQEVEINKRSVCPKCKTKSARFIPYA